MQDSRTEAKPKDTPNRFRIGEADMEEKLLNLFQTMMLLVAIAAYGSCLIGIVLFTWFLIRSTF